MDNTYLLTVNQVHSAVERYTTDALVTKKLKCKPGFVQRGAVCQPMKTAKGGLGALETAALAGAALAGGAVAGKMMNQQPKPAQNTGGSILGGIGKGALAGGGVGLLAGVGSGLYDEYQRYGVSPDNGKIAKNTRDQRGRSLAAFGGLGAGALAYNLGQSKISGNSLDKSIGGVGAGLAGAGAAYAGYGLGKNLTRMAANALRERSQRNREPDERNQRKMLPPARDNDAQSGSGSALSVRQNTSLRERDYLQVRGTRELPLEQERLRGGRDRNMLPPGSRRPLPPESGGGVLTPSPRRPLLPSGSGGLKIPVRQRSMERSMA